jgi:hypothetical protein
MAQYDVFDIERRLKEYDPCLRIEWDPEDCVHEVIYRNPVTTQDEIVMTVQPGQLDARVERRVKEIDRMRGYDPFKEIQKALDERDREQERKIEDLAYDMANTIRRPLIEDAFY